MNFPTFIMLIGLPGSGKSTVAETYKALGYHIHSSDEIREELSGDVNNQNINGLVFQTLHKRIMEDLSNGISCVYDATNISYKRRMSFLQEVHKKIFCWKKAVVVATPDEVCLQQNEGRERTVPEEVLERMYRHFDPPYYYEGWNEIEIHYNDLGYKSLYGTPSQFIFDTVDFDQQNKYHNETLGEHCRKAREYVIKNYSSSRRLNYAIVAEAAEIHDNGKPFCKTFTDAKGNPSDSAHYYDHEHVGSYNSYFYDTGATDKTYLAALVRWHMQMHFIDKQPHTAEKYKKLFGDKMWQDMRYLHKADKEAHNNEIAEQGTTTL